MTDPVTPEAAEERNVQRILAAACRPEAPPLSSDLPARLADRARREDILTLAAAACSTAGILLPIAVVFLPWERLELRAWAVVLPAMNILLAPFAAYLVVRNMKGRVSHA